MSAPLYSREILALAVDVGQYPRLAAPALTGDKRAMLCGSRVMMDLSLEAAGRVAAIGLGVEACALGQASAALLANSIVGKSAAELDNIHQELTAWLDGGLAALPAWPGLAALAAARDYPARHAAILLPFAVAAELSAQSGRRGQAA
jgi:NifU-like protein involved in Fe-S cluster formation